MKRARVKKSEKEKKRTGEEKKRNEGVMEDGFKLAQHTQKKRNKIKTFTTRQRQPTLSAVFIASTQLSVSRFSQFTDGPVSEGRLTLLYAFLTAIFDKIPLQI